LPGVRVTKSGALVGVTDASGAVFVPSLGSYQVNSVEIQPKDIPLEYSLQNTRQDLRPPLRGGVVATFAVIKMRAVTGKLVLKDGDIRKPLDDYEFILSGAAVDAKAGVQVRTVRGGDFYLENVPPGDYTAALRVSGRLCKLALKIPQTADIVADLGEVICEITP
jgi:outer membrane usher protein